MKPFSPGDARRLEAAEGWLELGDCVSAFNELEEVAPERRAHPDVLKLRWRIYIKAEKFGNAFTVAEGLTRLLPDEVDAFVWRSYSTRRMEGGGVQQAFDLLRDVAEDFRDEPIVPFNLACYLCQLNQLAEAKSWLHLAFDAAERQGTAKHYKALALDDPDLLSLRQSAAL